VKNNKKQFYISNVLRRERVSSSKRPGRNMDRSK